MVDNQTEREVVIRLDNVDAHYGQAQALERVSLEVYRGETVSIVGANGAGKSTCLKVISGLLRPTTGHVMVCGEDAARLSPAKLVKLGLAHSPEGRRVFASMTVRENLFVGAFTVSDRSVVEERLADVMRFFPILQERRDQLAGTLSGGQQQMLAIARAMMSGPSILMLDEPTLGLSPLMSKEVGALISEIRKRGLTVVLVEQNAEIALGVADRAYIMESGRVVASGDARDISASDTLRRAYFGA
ncbi:MAG: ABC transporter ATP-binding protein [Rhizobiaceae bacterium]|nr:ABC transporter ATP-binding protein [Rhizobiaceae bacterium]